MHDELVRDHASLVHVLARRMWARCPSHIELKELHGAAACGLVEASRAFDSTRGISFSSFAALRIRGAMLDTLRKMDWTPRSVLRRRRSLAEVLSKLQARLGRAAEESEVAAELGIELAEYQSLLEELRGVRLEPLEDGDGDEENSQAAVLIEDFFGKRPDELLQDSEVVEALGTAIDKLPQQEKLAITLYFYEGLTLKEVGAILKVTESRVSQLKSAAVSRLRGFLNAQS